MHYSNHLKVSLFFMLMAFFLLPAKAQKNQGIKQNEVILLQQITKHQVNYGCSEKRMLENFGKPDVDKKFFFEMDDKNGKLLIYQNCKFYFLDNKLMGFELLSPAYIIMMGKSSMPIWVGQSPKFPPGISTKSPKFVSYDLKNSNGRATDQFLEFTLDNNQSKIKSIILGDY